VWPLPAVCSVFVATDATLSASCFVNSLEAMASSCNRSSILLPGYMINAEESTKLEKGSKRTDMDEPNESKHRILADRFIFFVITVRSSWAVRCEAVRL
jgi:hypothetical protein